MSTLSVDDRVLGSSRPGVCECGCGETTTVYEGKPRRFRSGHNGALRKREDRYEVRDCGYETACWVWLLALGNDGYGRDCIAGRQLLAHRASYETHTGPIPARMQIDHLCRNRACVNPAHLELVTNAENTRRGNATKLTREDVKAIKRSGLAHRRLAEIYGVSYAHISHIQTGRKWTAV